MAAIGYFKSPSTGNAVTWDENGTQTDTGIAHDAYKLPSAQTQGPTFGGGAAAPGSTAQPPAQQSQQSSVTPDGTPYFISPSTGNMVTWDSTGKQTDTGTKPGLAQNLGAGYGASMPVDPSNPSAGANRGTGSVWNHISDMPADTYQSYLTKMGSMKTNEMGAWLQGGSAPLSEAEWNAQRARVAADQTSFGGGSGPGQKTQANSASGTGILGQGTSASGTSASPSSAGGNGTVPWNVTADQTVEGRVAGILSGGSPIIQQARARARQEMNDRGLVDSSIATTASDLAAYQAAIPIAQADAATYSKAAGYNADQQNQFSTNAMNRSAQMDIARLNSETSKTIASMNNEQSTMALKLQLDNKTLLDSNAQAAQAFNTGMSAVNNIQMNDKMDANAKTIAIGTVWKNVQTQLKTLSAVSGLNLYSDLQFAGFPGFDDKGNWVGFAQ